MKIPVFYTSKDALSEKPWRTLADVLLILVLVSAMIAISAHSPSNTYSYAQYWQIHASIDHMNGGSLILPKIDGTGTPARKPQLYAWILTATMKITGLRNEVIFRMPTILAGAGLALLIYFLGRRWYGRGPGLVAACFWTIAVKMNKLFFLATTDMLLAFWIGMCVFCVDRLTFHPARKGRWAWAVAFWASMILAGITKGWGIVNLAIIGGFLALASAVGPGFSAVRSIDGAGNKILLSARLVFRRWWAVIRACKLGWGVLAMLAVFVPLWWAMLHVGGERFQATVRYEVWQRLTGQGQYAPGSVSGPAVAHLYYNLLPTSIFAGCVFVLVPVRRWLSRKSPIALPLMWIIIVLCAFAIPHGFRPDYLLPCYAAVALLAGWAACELARPERWNHRVAKHFRRICQAVPFVLAFMLITVPLAYFFHDKLPVKISKNLSMPPQMLQGTWYILAGLPGLCVLIVGAGVWAIRRRRMGLTVAAVCIGMLGVLFCNCHLFTRHARTGDGDVMVQFGRGITPILQGEPFALYGANKLGVEASVGRFGWQVDDIPGQASTRPGEQVVDEINASDVRWMIVSDYGLVSLGAYSTAPEGPYRVKINGVKHRFMPRPQDIGRVVARSTSAIQFENWGTIYLIEIRRPVQPESKPFFIGYISDPVK